MHPSKVSGSLRAWLWVGATVAFGCAQQPPAQAPIADGASVAVEEHPVLGAPTQIADVEGPSTSRECVPGAVVQLTPRDSARPRARTSMRELLTPPCASVPLSLQADPDQVASAYRDAEAHHAWLLGVDW